MSTESGFARIRGSRATMSINSLGGTQLAAVADVLQSPADSFGNDESLEMHWAIKAYEHAEVYFNLVTSVDTTKLRLTKVDDQIYQLYKAEFPDLDVNKLNVDQIKSTEGKAKWREFCNIFEGNVKDFNMGTLLRIDASLNITDENTFLVPRIQFLAIEICRNREGFNSLLRDKYQKKKPEGS